MMKVNKQTRRILYIITTLSWVTGVVYFILDQFVLIEGDFGPEKSPFQYPIIKLHGLTAFLLMINFGYFLSHHIKYTWRKKPRDKMGILLVSLDLSLIISGYLLYYIVTGDSRMLTAYLHTFIGIVYPIVLTIHIRKIVRERKKQKLQRAT
jgi:hypothetical protein